MSAIAPDRVQARAEKAKVDKFAAKRRELADAALTVIADSGFARTGLRDIAAGAGLSHGVLHYYFKDKDDLVSQAIWQYKSQCARRYDHIVQTAQSPEELADGVGAEMSSTLVKDAAMHRLWYDLRNQAMFEDGFRDTIVTIDALLSDMVWAITERYATLSGHAPALTPSTMYALFDGVFLNSLIAHLRGDPDAIDRVRVGGPKLLEATV